MDLGNDSKIGFGEVYRGIEILQSAYDMIRHEIQLNPKRKLGRGGALIMSQQKKGLGFIQLANARCVRRDRPSRPIHSL
jgi:hypothetical protein